MMETLENAPTKVPVGILQEHPENARRGNVGLIAESLKRLGQYRPVVVNLGSQTGRPNEILAGHHIVKAIKSLGWPEVKVTWVDVDEDDGRAILAVDNRAPELGDYDTAALYALLSQMPDLAGTGYADDDLADMRVLLEQSASEIIVVDDGLEPEGKPKFDFDPDRWAKSDKRIMVLDMPVPVFIWMQDQLTEIAKELDLPSNVDVVVKLVSLYVGSDAPVVEDSHDADEN
jgi:hypothetical protein